MDPYLEHPAFGPDFHFTFINYWREALVDQLPDDYEANFRERVYLVEHDPESRKLVLPDVSVSLDRHHRQRQLGHEFGTSDFPFARDCR
jgi:hypothetical protein